ncbi:unnamed protein product [Ceutorhynchus assimilis]|uniref:Uncharacterized protein n=1 Tax=Ceutorhynchus assimilis TaxID=467358 RepID=A0A9N9QI26_9CUCU|nr:unnamed protein product [Ceutorhynchus assimilis]
MRFVSIIFLSVLLSLGNCAKYTTKYDSIDLDSIIKNDRLMKNYVDCMMERKKCSRDAAELKKHLPDALQNNCASCSEIQRIGSRKVLTHIIQNKRDWFLEVEAKYDPNHVFRRLYQEELQRKGVAF